MKVTFHVICNSLDAHMEHIIGIKVLILDDADEHLIQGGRLTAASRGDFARCGQRSVHHLVSGAQRGQRVRALDGNLFNCRRENLRVIDPVEREVMRIEHERSLLQARVEAQPMLALPADLSSWGVLRTRCWQELHKQLTRALNSKRSTLTHLVRLTEMLSELPMWDMDRCVEYSMGRAISSKPAASHTSSHTTNIANDPIHHHTVGALRRS